MYTRTYSWSIAAKFALFIVQLILFGLSLGSMTSGTVGSDVALLVVIALMWASDITLLWPGGLGKRLDQIEPYFPRNLFVLRIAFSLLLTIAFGLATGAFIYSLASISSDDPALPWLILSMLALSLGALFANKVWIFDVLEYDWEVEKE